MPSPSPSPSPPSLSTSQPSLLDPSPTPSSPIDSLPDSASSDTISSPSEADSDADAEREWKESLQQLELLLTMVLVPYTGKYFGRKCAYWGWAKYMQWKYPVEIVVTSPGSFKAAGAVEAAATL